MAKIVFFNVDDMSNLNIDRESDKSWHNSPRVSSLLSSPNTEVCLYHLDTVKLSQPDIFTLIQLSGISKLCTTDFRMSVGLYPLLLNGNTLFFTDIEEYSYMDCNWALDHVYKTPLDTAPQFQYFSLQIPQGWEQVVINENNIRIRELFSIIKKQSTQVNNFCQTNKGMGARLEIIYTDKYVKKELGMIICLQFIKDIINEIGPSDYSVKMVGETFIDSYANLDNRRRLEDNFMNNDIRDEMGKSLVNANEHYTFESIASKDLPHYRELLVQVTINNQTNRLRIMPDAGLAHWKLDIGQSKADGIFYASNNGMDDRIPLYCPTSQVFYIGY